MLNALLLVFGMNVVASCMKVLNTVFISKKIMKPVYITLFVDAIVFSLGLKMVANGDSFYLILAFALGKVCGAYLADIIEDKLALGILEVSVYASVERGVILADALRKMGYGVTTVKGYGMGGTPRLTIDITIERKEVSVLKSILHKNGFDDATMVVRDIKKVSGKIKTSHMA